MMHPHKIVKVALREYIETIKTRTFLLSILFTPLLMVIIVFVVGQVKKAATGPRDDKVVAVIDRTGLLSEELERKFGQYNVERPERRIRLKLYHLGDTGFDALDLQLRAEVLGGKTDAGLVIAAGAIEAEGELTYYTRDIADRDLFANVYNLANLAIRDLRFRQHELPPELIAELDRSVPVKQIDLGLAIEEMPDVEVVLMVPFFFLFLMYTAILGTSQGMLTSVLEEKSTRTMEVLLSALSPLELMAGKIVGLTAVGLTLVTIWGASSYLAAASQGISGLVTADSVIYFVIYYVLGFLLIASILAAVGSVCNTLKEAQGLMAPITLLLFVPLVAWYYIAQDPTGTAAVVMSFIPPITPMVMIIRIAARPYLPKEQIVLSMLLLAASIPLVMWASAKVFRTGILMYGKPPSLRELFRWLRYK